MPENENRSKAGKAGNQISVPLVREGKVTHVFVERPNTPESDEELLPELARYVQTLEDNRQIEHEGNEPTGDETHRLRTEPDGTRRLQRKRFSAI
jgi:hypothetical protein